MLDFLCIGAQKAGTSWLYKQLERHPEIGFPHGKEVHYWDWVQAGKRPDDIAWYRRKFVEQPGKRLGDITPAYAILEPRWIEQIAMEYPEVRILMILRNPIERAWSSARMAFEYAQLSLLEADVNWFRTHLNSAASRARGDYEKTLRNWHSVFDYRQIQVLFYEDLDNEPAKFLQDVCRTIRVDSDIYQAQTQGMQRRFNAGQHIEMPEVLRAELKSFYLPKIRSLEQYLQVDLTHWL